MYTVIRRYQGVVDSAEVARRAAEEFGPTLRDQPGFQGYWAVDAGDGVLATISVFDSRDAAEASTAAAATWGSAYGGTAGPAPPRLASAGHLKQNIDICLRPPRGETF